MSDDQTVEAYRLTQQADSFAEKVNRRARDAVGLKGFRREKAWLADAQALLGDRMEPLVPVLKEAQRLPELAHERENFAREPQNEWVDAVEKLWAGISFHLGRRAPLLEALFPHQKFPLLRKPKPEVVRAYAEELQRRIEKSYVQRMLAGEDCAFAQPVLDEVQARFTAYEATLSAEPLEGAEAGRIRKSLLNHARKLEAALKQARYLFEAAALTLPEPELDEPTPDPSEDDADSP